MSKNISLIFSLTFICFSLTNIIAQTIEPPESNSNSLSIALYNTTGVYKLSDNLKTNVLIGYSPEVNLKLGVIDVIKKIDETFVYGTSYLYIKKESKTEHLFRGHFHLNHTLKKIKFNLRNALDYRVKTGNFSSYWRFRTRFRSTYSGSIKSIKYKAYAYLEPIYNFTQGKLTRFDLSIGTQIPITKHLIFHSNYIRFNFNKRPDINIYGLGIIVLF